MKQQAIQWKKPTEDHKYSAIWALKLQARLLQAYVWSIIDKNKIGGVAQWCSG